MENLSLRKMSLPSLSLPGFSTIWALLQQRMLPMILPDLHQFIATKLKGELKHDYEDKFKDIIPCKTEAYKARICQIQLQQERKAEKEKEKKEHNAKICAKKQKLMEDQAAAVAALAAAAGGGNDGNIDVADEFAEYKLAYYEHAWVDPVPSSNSSKAKKDAAMMITTPIKKTIVNVQNKKMHIQYTKPGQLWSTAVKT
jgi:hypothetical protein